MRILNDNSINSLFHLFTCMVKGNRTDIVLTNGQVLCNKLIQGIEREDGSGKNWLITYYNESGKRVEGMYIRAQ